MYTIIVSSGKRELFLYTYQLRGDSRDSTILKEFSHFFAYFFTTLNKKARAEVVYIPPPILTDFLFVIERFSEFSQLVSGLSSYKAC